MTKPAKLTIKACLRRKQIYISRSTIALLGNPSHLSFRYNENAGLLYVAATSENDMDSFEIPKYFWNSSGPCVVARIAFLRAMQYWLNWEDDAEYSYSGTSIGQMGFPIVEFKMIKGMEIVECRQSEPFGKCFCGFGMRKFPKYPPSVVDASGKIISSE